MDEQSTWKLAIKDSSHPLHQATWLLFAENMNVKGAAKLLAAQREEVIVYLYQILDALELRLETAFGGGFAPINAVDLLGEWNVVEAVPRMLDILREDNWESGLDETCILALEKMDSTIIPQMLAFGIEYKNEPLEVTTASIFSRVAKDNIQIFEWMIEVFKRQKSDDDITLMAANLLSTHMEAAIAFLDDYLKKSRVPKHPAQRIQFFLQMARKEIWEE
jgi:hypothetical protein